VIQIAALVLVMLASVLAAQWLAHRKRRSALRWMVAAALLGPLPLMPLALMHKRFFHP
jgi:uncharacterized membrane protein YfcA